MANKKYFKGTLELLLHEILHKVLSSKALDGFQMSSSASKSSIPYNISIQYFFSVFYSWLISYSTETFSDGQNQVIVTFQQNAALKAAFVCWAGKLAVKVGDLR